MNVLAVIQARMGSTRLPGKMLFSLGGRPTIQRVIQRVSAANHVDDVVVATSERPRDDAIESYAGYAGASVFRGSETDVLGRVHAATRSTDPDLIVRVCGDCPLLDPVIVDAIVALAADEGVDYASNTIERTFPAGLVAEAFTATSFDAVNEVAESDRHREHVTQFYHDRSDRFSLANVTSRDIYEEAFMHDRTDLRFALDVASDYELIRRVYETAPRLGMHRGLLDIREVIRYVDECGLDKMNAHVK